MARPEFPVPMPGHWVSEEGRRIADEYFGRDRSHLVMGDMSDFQLANEQFLVDRYDLQLIAYQTAAKDRIRWLSAQLAYYKQLWERR